MVNYLQGLPTDVTPVEATVTLSFREEGKEFPSKVSELARSYKIDVVMSSPIS